MSVDTETKDTDPGVAEDPSLGMSDEDFLNMDTELLTPTEDPEESSDLSDDSADTSDTDDQDNEDTSESEDAVDDEQTAAEDEETTSDDEEETSETDEESEEDTEPDTDGDADDSDQDDDSKIDYKAAYEKLTSPFRANGKDMQIDSVDDALQLMRMGANYNKKMAAMKPSLKILKMLENNKLLDTDKLSFLIDIDKGNPEAIEKLVRDNKIDPLSLNQEDAKEYKQKPYFVDDKEIEFDAVIDEIKDSPNYTQTLDIVGTKWDEASKKTVSDAPQILGIINDHLASGVYDLISAEVEKERMVGRLNGLSDIQAYKQVGDALQDQGAFDHLFKDEKQTPPKDPVTPAKKKATNPKLKDKRRAASPSKPSAPSKEKPDFNPLALSDEEFSKQMDNKFL